jgi:hypothetical protein
LVGADQVVGLVAESELQLFGELGVGAIDAELGHAAGGLFELGSPLFQESADALSRSSGRDEGG